MKKIKYVVMEVFFLATIIMTYFDMVGQFWYGVFFIADIIIVCSFIRAYIKEFHPFDLKDEDE